MEFKNKLIVSASPHIKTNDSSGKIMWSVVLALIPAGAAGVFIFGLSALNVIITAVVSAVISEMLIQKLMHKEVTVADGSAFITGLLLAYNMPPSVPLWLPVIGSFFAIAIAKQVFGGLGFNIFNPALAGRAFLMASWPAYMTHWTNPRWTPDAISSATPLAVVKMKLAQAIPSYWQLFIGEHGGCLGEVCVAAILVGAIFLLWKGYIRMHTPLFFIFTVALLSWMFMGKQLFFGDWVFYTLSGGLVLGAFFMATDYTTTPLTGRGQIIFGLGCGILTFLIRKFGGYPEGVSYSILIMNSATPIIDRYTKTKKFGFIKK
ncbi:MAG: RnfABCDGE type electron transport complex subunit D [Candidatus Omnitrophica bacterium]|nr:RnfABCDGE type electron transport complex subunit D [Candidatus Omnitrophota bacterium]